MSKSSQIRWQPAVMLALLGVALGVSVADGRTGDALIIAVLLGIGLLLYGALAYLHVRPPHGRSRQGE